MLLCGFQQQVQSLLQLQWLPQVQLLPQPEVLPQPQQQIRTIRMMSQMQELFSKHMETFTSLC